jgi:splicing factor 3A subunit 2
MSAFEQRVEEPDRRFQYLLFAADPYETIAFKIPSWRIVKDFDKKEALVTHWDPTSCSFVVCC